MDDATEIDTESGTRPAAATGPPLRRGLEIGRYVLLSELGAGGMGVVWGAYDPELDRRVALKLLRADLSGSGSSGRARLIREAQALAKLNHPNVVSVHDAGVHETSVWIAMEYVDGVTLSDWLAERPRSWQAIVDVMVAAGRGLAAAHDQGMVHRDFKPANLMIGKDGRARVMDFGLVREHRRDASPEHATLELDSHPRSVSDQAMTATGAMMGTPAYMAPEQYRSAPVDPRTDQFSYCLTFWEALYGERPFSAKTVPALAAAVNAGELRSPPRGASVPAWLRKAIERGLAPAPEQRWPDIATLVLALTRDRTRTRRLVLVGAFGLLLTPLTIIGLWRGLAPDAPDPCAPEARRLDGIWDAEVRERIELSFAATELPYATQMFERVASSLDEHTREWASTRREVCEATLVHEQQPVEVMGEQMLCLERRLRRIAGLTAVLQHADVSTVARAPDSVLALEAARSCKQRGAEGRRELPSEQRRAELLEVESEVARAHVFVELGRYDEAIAASERASERARSLADPGGAGRAAFERMRALGVLGHYEAGIEAGEDAIRGAAAAADLETSALAQIEMIRIYTSMGEYRPAEALSKVVSAQVRDARLGKDIEAWHDLRAATLLGRQHRWDEALAKLEHGLAIRRELYGPDHVQLAAFHSMFGTTYLRSGRDLDLALEQYREALRLWVDNLGEHHPHVAAVRHNIGATYLERRELDAARESIELALASNRVTLGPTHPHMLSGHNNLGAIAQLQGRSRDARAEYEQGRVIAIANFGEHNLRTADVEYRIGELLVLTGEYEQAERLLEHALEVRRAELPSPSADVGLALESIADCRRARGDLDGARRRGEQAAEVYAALPADEMSAHRATLLRATFALDDGDYARARTLTREGIEQAKATIGEDSEEIASYVVVELTALLAMGDAEAAIARGREVLASPAVRPGQRGAWGLHLQLGRAQAQLGHTEAAIAALEDALALTSGPDGNPVNAAEVAIELAALSERDQGRAQQRRSLARGD